MLCDEQVRCGVVTLRRRCRFECVPCQTRVNTFFGKRRAPAANIEYRVTVRGVSAARGRETLSRGCCACAAPPRREEALIRRCRHTCEPPKSGACSLSTCISRLCVCVLPVTIVFVLSCSVRQSSKYQRLNCGLQDVQYCSF